MAKFRDEIGWVSETGVYSSIDVPILHKDWCGEYSLSTVFLNPKIMGVSHVLFLPYNELSRCTDLCCPHPWSQGRKAFHER
jgi:hypothetical protein